MQLQFMFVDLGLCAGRVCAFNVTLARSKLALTFALAVTAVRASMPNWKSRIETCKAGCLPANREQ